MQELLWSIRGVNWNNCATWERRGMCVIQGNMFDVPWIIDEDIPIFTSDREYINRLVNIPGSNDD